MIYLRISTWKDLFMLSKTTHIHFIGISGIGMSGIAKILLQQGYHVSGCDLAADSKHVAELKQLGCAIAPHHQHTICQDPSIEYVVYTTDIPLHHPEIVDACNRNVTIVHRATMLAEIMRSKFGIAIAGSHGKTTTTSLMTHVMLELQTDPTFIIGGHLNSLETNAQNGAGPIVIAEADESDRSFLSLPKTWSIVTNVDLEHLETYKDFNDVQQTFIAYMNQIPFYGCNIVCLDDIGIQSVIAHLNKKPITYGQHPQADIRIENIMLENDYSTFDIVDTRTNMRLSNIQTPLLGIHNVLNSASVIAMAIQLGFNTESIKTTIKSFHGVDRRFTTKGISKRHQAIVIDDYGHHPEEIRNVILIARKKAKNQLCMLFQPHRHSRTHHLWNDFIKVLSSPDIDHLIITDIFAKGEQPIAGFSSENMVQEIKKMNSTINAIYLPLDHEGQTIIEYIHSILQPNDVLMLQGAGKINNFSKEILR